MQNSIIQVLNSIPVNRQAAIIVSQSRCVKEDKPLTKKELVDLLNRLIRKQRLLKHILGIKTRSQHNNAIWKFNKHIPQFRNKENPRCFIEYKRVGEEMQRLNKELAELKKIRRYVAEISNNKIHVVI